MLLILLSLAFQTDSSANKRPLLTEQGRLFDQHGNPIEGRVTLTFSAYDRPLGGEPLWQETLNADLRAGYFSVPLGETVPFPAGLWNGSTRYVGLRVNDDEEMTPREPIRSVPHAIIADDARGDIHPSSVSVAGKVVIDSSGRWVGSASGLAGPSGPQGEAGPPGATHRWQGYLFGPLAPGRDSAVAHFSVEAPDRGFIAVRAHFLNAARNFFDGVSNPDCVVSSQLAAAPGTPGEGIGMARIYVNGALPTQNVSGGAYQTFFLTAERSFAVNAGETVTVYLNGHVGGGCRESLWFHVQMIAEFTKNYSELVVVPN